ncbi:MAG TPA: DUF1326 domain-containing protein, partial [Acidobacteriota bacterium]
MKKIISCFGVFLIWLWLGFCTNESGAGNAARPAQPQWSMNATAIEACSCPLFCQCYFNTKPAAHMEHGEAMHYCRTNMAYKINRGYYGSTNLDGAKFWIAADVGSDFSSGRMEWSILFFDRVTTPLQRQAIETIVAKLFPVQWKSYSKREGIIDIWKYDHDTAHATLDGGKTAEIKLKRFPGMTSEPVILKNVKYWAAPRNDGFLLMPNE